MILTVERMSNLVHGFVVLTGQDVGLGPRQRWTVREQIKRASGYASSGRTQSRSFGGGWSSL
ncbi:MAG: hypothetical protein IID05_14195 [Gemmatimonadetes bacterium]|nr:hypothetical protein [Gemmatimonadota bacterium]